MITFSENMKQSRAWNSILKIAEHNQVKMNEKRKLVFSKASAILVSYWPANSPEAQPQDVQETQHFNNPSRWASESAFL